MLRTRWDGSGSQPGRSGRRRRHGICAGRGRLVSGLLVLSLGLLVFAAPVGTAAARTATPDPSPSPSPSPVRSTDPPRLTPTIDSPPPGSFVGSGTTTVSGTGEVGQEIQLLSPVEGNDPLCFVTVDDSAAWSCPGVTLPSGPSVRLRAVVTGDATLAAEHTISVLAAPTVAGGPTGQAASNGVVRGTGYPDASVIATLAGGNRCTATADAAGAWSCAFDGNLASGAAPVTAVQQTSFSLPSSSNTSAPVTLLFDVDRPGAPAVTSPVNGAQLPLAGTTYSGSGEDGATVTVFAGPYSLCSVVVTSGSWRCSAGGVAAGSYLVIAVQQDPAGNVGPGSPGISVLYGAAGTPPRSSDGTAPSAAAAPPASRAPQAETAPSKQPSATPTPEPSRPAVALPPTTPGGWNDPTQFATAVLPLGAASDFSWFQASLFALGALLLLCVPARLLSGTISRARNGRPLWNGAAIAGRNRAREEFETAPALPLNRWLVAGAACAAAATLVMLSGPVTSQPAYLRLLVAVMVALVVVNGVGALVPLWWSSRVWQVKASVTFLPRYLLLVAVTALASRAFEIHPALVFGLLGSVAVTPGVLDQRRGQLAAVRASSLIGLAVVGWLVLGALPQAIGFLSAFAAEVVNSVVLAAIGSAVLVLIPIGRTSGRSILAWSPPIWAGLATLAFTILFGVLSPVVELWHGDGSVTLLWVASGVFAALSVGAWGWQRFVVPSLA
jgi:hypothetical protein